MSVLELVLPLTVVILFCLGSMLNQRRHQRQLDSEWLRFLRESVADATGAPIPSLSAGAQTVRRGPATLSEHAGS